MLHLRIGLLGLSESILEYKSSIADDSFEIQLELFAIVMDYLLVVEVMNIDVAIYECES